MKITTTYGDLALIKFPAQKPITEKLEWLTDTFIANDGTEYRESLRSMPRQIFEYTIPLTFWKKIESLNTIRGGIRQKWAVPIWTEAQFVGNLSAAQTQILCDTSTNYWFKVGGLVYLYSSNGENQFGEIEVRYANALDLVDGVTAQNNVYLMPLKIGYIQGEPRHSTNGLESVVTIRFLIQDYTDIGTIDVPEQFEGNDVYTEAPITNGFTDRTFSQEYEQIDFELGIVDIYSPLPNSRYGYQLGFICDGAAEIQKYKQFLYRREGKYKNFWIPSFENDIEHVSTGPITTTLLVKRDSIDEYVLDRTFISILIKNGNWNHIEIESITLIDSERVQFNFGSSVGIDSEDIIMISYLNFCRLNADNVDIRWIGNNVIESEIVVTEGKLFSNPIVVVE